MGAATTNDPADAAKGLDTNPWLGRTETCTDQISHNLAVRIAATLGEPTPAPGSAPAAAVALGLFPATRAA